MGRFVGYLRVSTLEQGDSGLGLEAQLSAIRIYTINSGHELVEVVREVESAASHRPKFEETLERVEAGEFDGIIASRLDRFARSVVQTDDILRRLEKAGKSFVALDLGIDTSTAAGRLVTNVLAAVAQWERDIISERTRAALRAKREAGWQPGRERLIGDETRALVHQLKADGLGHRRIAAELDNRGIKPPQSKKWSRGTIQRLLEAGPPSVIQV